MSDLISRADAKEAVYLLGKRPQISDVWDCLDALPSAETTGALDDAIAKYVADGLMELPSANAVQGWRIGKPTEQGEYMVTLDSFGYKHIDLFYYGKPLMPNRKVRGKCWYRSDDEWGDVVYDDKDILAWMPLPKPYREENEE